MHDRTAVLIDALRRASAGEWVEADPVARRLREDGHGHFAAPVIGRWLSKLAAEGHCERAAGPTSKYRIGLHAVVLYEDGVEAGRLLLWQTREGVELDLRKVGSVRAVPLSGGGIRTVRASLDEALSRVNWPMRHIVSTPKVR